MAGCERNDLGAAVEQERIAEDYESPGPTPDKGRERLVNVGFSSDVWNNKLMPE